jgi:hypothetical protein
MFTKPNRTKSIITALGAAVVAMAAPAMLFAGAGTAQAAATLNTTSDPIGVTVEVHSTGSEGLSSTAPSRGSDGRS